MFHAQTLSPNSDFCIWQTWFDCQCNSKLVHMSKPTANKSSITHGNIQFIILTHTSTHYRLDTSWSVSCYCSASPFLCCVAKIEYTFSWKNFKIENESFAKILTLPNTKNLGPSLAHGFDICILSEQWKGKDLWFEIWRDKDRTIKRKIQKVKIYLSSTGSFMLTQSSHTFKQTSYRRMLL